MPLTLFQLCLDKIILTYHPKIIKNILNLPICLLEAIDKREQEISNTKSYKKRFLK